MISGFGHRPEHFDGARRGIESDAVGDTAVTVGIIGQYNRHPPVCLRGSPQPRPARRQLGDKLHPVRFRRMGDDIGLNRLIKPCRRFERHRA